MVTFNTKEMKTGMNDVMNNIKQLRNDSEKLIAWVKTVDTKYDKTITTIVVEDTIDIIDNIKYEYETCILELFKHNKLDATLKEDLAKTLLAKKQARQIYALISEIIKEKENNTFEVEKFVADRKLEVPGTVCSR